MPALFGKVHFANLQPSKATPVRNKSSKSIFRKFTCYLFRRAKSTLIRPTISPGCNQRVIQTRPTRELELSRFSACRVHRVNVALAFTKKTTAPI